jgi:hypothetical protein
MRNAPDPRAIAINTSASAILDNCTSEVRIT